MSTPAQHAADDCPFGTQLLMRGTPPSTRHVCPVCGREWFVGSIITPIEPESVFARLGRWFRSVTS